MELSILKIKKRTFQAQKIKKTNSEKYSNISRNGTF